MHIQLDAFLCGYEDCAYSRTISKPALTSVLCVFSAMFAINIPKEVTKKYFIVFFSISKIDYVIQHVLFKLSAYSRTIENPKEVLTFSCVNH